MENSTIVFNIISVLTSCIALFASYRYYIKNRDYQTEQRIDSIIYKHVDIMNDIIDRRKDDKNQNMILLYIQWFYSKGVKFKSEGEEKFNKDLGLQLIIINHLEGFYVNLLNSLEKIDLLLNKSKANIDEKRFHLEVFLTAISVDVHHLPLHHVEFFKFMGRENKYYTSLSNFVVEIHKLLLKYNFKDNSE